MPLFSSLGINSSRSLGLGTSSVKDPYFNDRLAFTLPNLALPGTNANTTAFIDSGTANTGSTGFTVNRFGNTHMGSYTPFSRRGDPDNKRWGYEFGGGGLNFPLAVMTNFVGLGSRRNTWEFWIKPKIFHTGVDNGANAGQSAFSGVIGAYEAVAANGRWAIGLSRNGAVNFANTLSTASEVWYTTTLRCNIHQWNHVVVDTNGITGVLIIYINGVGQTFTGLNFSTQNSTYTGAYGISRSFMGGWHNAQIGALSNFRWVAGEVYTGNFTPPTEPLKRIPNTLLLTFQEDIPIDNSGSNHALDIFESATLIQSSPFPVNRPAYDRFFETGSAFFDGTGDYLTIPDNATLEIGSSEFCAELMFNPTSATTSILFGKRANNTAIGSILIVYSSGAIQVYLSSNGTSWNIAGGTSLGTVHEGSWNHVSVYRVGNDWYGSLNGVITLLLAGTAATIVNNAVEYHIGADLGPSNLFIGYISNVRLVIGSSPYTATSAPRPTAPLTNITNTKLLLLMNNFNYFDPTRQNTIETVGTIPIVSTKSKWGNSVLSLSRSSGAVNALLVPNREHLNFNRDGTQVNDFTIEFWIYPTSLNVTDGIIVQKDGVQGTNYSQWKVALTSANTGNVVFSAGNPAGASSKQDVTSNVAVTINSWNHVACQRVSNNYVVYVNGTLAANAVISVDVTASTRPMYINGQQSGLSTSGVDAYLDGLRIVRGVSVYSGAPTTIPKGPFGNQ
jgi:hypothetical protein